MNNVILKTKNGELINGDNVEVLKKLKDNFFDSCISDFPYNLSFMGKKWDTQKDFYEWCRLRAKELFRVMKPGGLVLIFGHPKTNHRMKCGFEDVGFRIVEEIDWIYFTGFPKNQDIGKMFDKKLGKERNVIGKQIRPDGTTRENTKKHKGTVFQCGSNDKILTSPSSDIAKQWNGYKTPALKPAKEPITVFQKPIEKNYCYNIEKWDCGGMNIDACRIGYSKDNDDKRIGKNYSHTAKAGLEIKIAKNNSEGKKQLLYKLEGRFPPNIIFDEMSATLLDEQSGVSKSTGGRTVKRSGGGNVGSGKKSEKWFTNEDPGFGDSGGGSRFFYIPKVSPSERKLPNGERNTHVTLKPKELIKYLIKLSTPENGITVDITAGTGTHAVVCEELNRNEGYNLKWVNIELLNTEDDPNCDMAKMRIESVMNT